MITKLSRHQCIELNPQLPLSDDEKGVYIFPKILASHILISDLAKNAEKIAYATTDFVHLLGICALTFLGETDMPWLSQKNEIVPVREAFQYFKKQKIDAKFNGGFIVDDIDLAEFIKHLFVLTRFNAAFPSVYFADDNKGLICSLCRYGNLHLFTLTESIENLLISIVDKSEFKFGSDIRC